MIGRLVLPALLAVSLLAAESWERQVIASTAPHRIRGFTESSDKTSTGFSRSLILTWGDGGIDEWWMPGGAHKHVSDQVFDGPVVVADLNGDGTNDLAGVEGQRLLWLEASSWTSHTIDTGVVTRDVIAFRRGGKINLITVQLGIQARMHTPRGDPRGAWERRDFYSFYHPEQGGFARADIDRDGLEDILVGNYWMKNPGVTSESWRIYAINVWHESPLAGVASFAWWRLGGQRRLVISQRAMAGAGLAWYEMPSDPKQIWDEHRIEESLDLTEPAFVKPGYVDDDNFEDLIVAERGGRGRLIVFRQLMNAIEAEVIAESGGIGALAITDWNRDGRSDIIAAEGPQLVLYVARSKTPESRQPE